MRAGSASRRAPVGALDREVVGLGAAGGEDAPRTGGRRGAWRSSPSTPRRCAARLARCGAATTRCRRWPAAPSWPSRRRAASAWSPRGRGRQSPTDSRPPLAGAGRRLVAVMPRVRRSPCTSSAQLRSHVSRTTAEEPGRTGCALGAVETVRRGRGHCRRPIPYARRRAAAYDLRMAGRHEAGAARHAACDLPVTATVAGRSPNAVIALPRGPPAAASRRPCPIRRRADGMARGWQVQRPRRRGAVVPGPRPSPRRRRRADPRAPPRRATASQVQRHRDLVRGPRRRVTADVLEG